VNYVEPTLFPLEPIVVPDARGGTIQERFDAFDRANPWIYNALVELSRELLGSGKDRIGMKMLFEVLRWEYLKRTTDEASDFKLSNSYTSRYARRIMAQEHELDGIFETRPLVSA